MLGVTEVLGKRCFSCENPDLASYLINCISGERQKQLLSDLLGLVKIIYPSFLAPSCAVAFWKEKLVPEPRPSSALQWLKRQVVTDAGKSKVHGCCSENSYFEPLVCVHVGAQRVLQAICRKIMVQRNFLHCYSVIMPQPSFWWGCHPDI